MRLIHTQTVCISLLIIGLTFTYARSGLTQATGEVGEMDRLEQKAEDAIANGDPEGAALSIGKAALMANLLAQKEDVTRQIRLLYQAADTLFRGQEQGYRALALFERAVGIYAELVNINAYHQPGVEAGKKAAAQVLDLTHRIIKIVAEKRGMELSLEEIAAAAKADDAEAVFLILRRLSAGPHARINRVCPKECASPLDWKWTAKAQS